MTSSDDNKDKAQALHARGQQYYADGDEAAALEMYAQAIALDPDKAESYYNIGLIHKYRGEWELSLKYNAVANQLDPDDEAARWNLAIAATALRRWEIARAAWLQNGLVLEGEAGPIDMNFGNTPVRLNPDSAAEVVWARRIDPVRARIYSVPFTDSGYNYGDIVLHDGAAEGRRKVGEREYAVFNALELFEASGYSTAVAVVELTKDEDLDALEQMLDSAAHAMDDWTSNVRVLCKQCSEGVPHEHHDAPPPEAWRAERELGIAIPAGQDVRGLFDAWQAKTGARLVSLELNPNHAGSAG